MEASRAASVLLCEAKVLQRCREVPSGGHRLAGGNDNALTDAFGFGIGQLHLSIPFRGSLHTLLEDVGQRETAEQ